MRDGSRTERLGRGWYSADSFASSFPEPRELFLQTAHLINDDGEVGTVVPSSGGIFIRCDDATVVDFVRGADPRPEPTESATLGPRAGAEPSNAGQTNEQTGVADGVDPA